MHIFKKFYKLCVTFSRVWTKNTMFGQFSKFFLRKLLKMHNFCIFFKSKPCVTFLPVWTKNANCSEILRIFDENAIEKLNIFILENLLLKIEPSEITPFFYNNFFGFGGGVGNFPLPPGYALGPPLVSIWVWLNLYCCSYFSSKF